VVGLPIDKQFAGTDPEIHEGVRPTVGRFGIERPTTARVRYCRQSGSPEPLHSLHNVVSGKTSPKT
jgi:hypothetical protein